MSSKKKVSIIVPVYNSEKYLEVCLESLVNQTYKNIEIILVNDGSTDNSANICDKYKKKDPRVKVRHIENQGVSNARYAGMKMATGDYIMFVDSDDYMSLTGIERLIRHSHADIVISGHKRVGANEVYNPDNKKVTCLKRSSIQRRGGEVLFDMLYHKGVTNSVWAKLYSRKVLNNTMFHEGIDIGEDLLFNYMVLRQVQQIELISDITYHYRDNPSSVMNLKFSKKNLTILNVIEIMQQGSKNNVELNKAVIHKSFMEAVYLLARIPSKKFEYDAKRCKEIIAQNKKSVLFNSKVNLINRIYALIATLSIQLLIKIVHLRAFLGKAMRGCKISITL